MSNSVQELDETDGAHFTLGGGPNQMNLQQNHENHNTAGSKHYQTLNFDQKSQLKQQLVKQHQSSVGSLGLSPESQSRGLLLNGQTNNALISSSVQFQNLLRAPMADDGDDELQNDSPTGPNALLNEQLLRKRNQIRHNVPKSLLAGRKDFDGQEEDEAAAFNSIIRQQQKMGIGNKINK